ncbi:hypothetical protein C3007_09915, partial [Avibacterium gallinarum]
AIKTDSLHGLEICGSPPTSGSNPPSGAKLTGTWPAFMATRAHTLLYRVRVFFVTGTRIDSVASVAHIQDEASLLAYMDDFKSRYPTYITGMATLQAFIELLYLTTKAQDEPRAAGEPELYATA